MVNLHAAQFSGVFQLCQVYNRISFFSEISILELLLLLVDSVVLLIVLFIHEYYALETVREKSPSSRI